MFSNAQSRSSTWCAKGDPLLVVSRSVISFSSTQPVVRIQHYTASRQWQSTRQAELSLDYAKLLVFIIQTTVASMSKTRALRVLGFVKTETKMWLFSPDFILNIPQCSYRGSNAEKLCEAQDVIFQPRMPLFLANAKSSEVLETLS